MELVVSLFAARVLLGWIADSSLSGILNTTPMIVSESAQRAALLRSHEGSGQEPADASGS